MCPNEAVRCLRPEGRSHDCSSESGCRQARPEQSGFSSRPRAGMGNHALHSAPQQTGGGVLSADPLTGKACGARARHAAALERKRGAALSASRFVE